MANGDTIRVEKPDGTTGTIPKSSLAKAQKAGWKVVDDPLTAGAKSFGREAALGGFSGLGIAESKSPITDTMKGMVQGPQSARELLTDPSTYLGSLYDVGKGLATSGAEMFEGLGADAQHPFRFGPFDPAKVGHGLGGLASQLLMLRGGEKASEKPFQSGTTKAVMRDVLGVGERDVAGEMKKTAGKDAKVQEAATKKVEAAKQKYAESVQDAIKKRAEASARETAAKTKQEALMSKHGPVYQRMNEMTDTAQQHIGNIEQAVKESEGKKWQKFNTEVHPNVETESVGETIEAAQKNILTGENLPIFKQIMNEIVADEDPLTQATVFKGKGGTGINEFLRTASPEVRQRLEAQGFTEETAPQFKDISLDKARRLYNKIGRKLGGTELPRDVARALGTVGDALDDTITKSIAKDAGAEGLKRYRKLQADWKQYRQTFSDRDSPLRKVMEAKDPSTKTGPITGETGARAIQYLGRYKDIDAAVAGAKPSGVEQLGKIRALHKALKELPGGGGKAPEMPERPTLPEKPEAKQITPEQARKEMLTRKESFYSRPPSRWELMFPPLLGYKMTLKHLMQNPKFIEWLSKDEPPKGTTPVP